MDGLLSTGEEVWSRRCFHIAKSSGPCSDILLPLLLPLILLIEELLPRVASLLKKEKNSVFSFVPLSAFPEFFP